MTYEPAGFPDLTGRTVVVTGAARGIGEEHVRGLVRNGANVVSADLDHDALAASARAMEDDRRDGARTVPVRADAARAEDHRELADIALAELGSLYG